MKGKFDFIKELIKEGKLEVAIEQLSNHIRDNNTDDEPYYLLGNAYRKKEDWQSALNNYQKAIDLNEESPARHAYKATTEILEFYNKDMFNQ